MLWRDNGRYPPWGESSEWDEVLEAKREMDDCERYHCLPSQLDGEDYHRLERHRLIRAAEQKYSAQVRRSRAAKQGRR